jgi:hypothetical protein
MDETASCQRALKIVCKKVLVEKSIAVGMTTAVVKEVS